MSTQNPLQESRSKIRLRLPATSANLGPGFDALGLALSLYLSIEAEEAEHFYIEATGRDAPLCGSLANNLILVTYLEVLGHAGVAAPSLSLRIFNEIPLGMGCGSSAAALLAGVLLANYFGGLQWSSQQLLDEACRREGHPDNVAACLSGGLTASRTVTIDSVEPEQTVTATLGQSLEWTFFLALPTSSFATGKARSLLPETYSRRDAVDNVQTTALLVSAFALDRIDLLQVAMSDRLHQPFRAGVCPLLPVLLPLAGHNGICGVALSGAGPAVLLIGAAEMRMGAVEKAVRTSAKEHCAEILRLRIGQAAMVSSLAR